MPKIIAIIASFFLFAIAVPAAENVAYADACEDTCFAQQNTCMGGCRGIKDTAAQNSCVRGCLRGGTACARRCRERGELRILPNDRLWAERQGNRAIFVSCAPQARSCRP